MNPLRLLPPRINKITSLIEIIESYIEFYEFNCYEHLSCHGFDYTILNWPRMIKIYKKNGLGIFVITDPKNAYRRQYYQVWRLWSISPIQNYTRDYSNRRVNPYNEGEGMGCERLTRRLVIHGFDGSIVCNIELDIALLVIPNPPI